MILLTGFEELASPESKAPEAVILVLSKPISLDALRQALVDVVAP